jgi:hypothetical protein
MTRVDILTNTLKDNLDRVEARIVSACARANRSRDSVRLVAVTKSVSPQIAGLLPQLGIADLGENRPQELWRKADLIAGVRWHMIGHLQRNKIERTLPLVHRIHSVDSVRLLEALSDCDVLLEFNCSNEASKGGFSPDDLQPILAALVNNRTVRVRGLMTMAAFSEDPQNARATFVQLRQLRDRLKEQLDSRHSLDELSMGMSGDFEVAIEEGATWIRLGTILFSGLPQENER